jgi:hypothetical protein
MFYGEEPCRLLRKTERADLKKTPKGTAPYRYSEEIGDGINALTFHTLPALLQALLLVLPIFHKFLRGFIGDPCDRFL